MCITCNDRFEVIEGELPSYAGAEHLKVCSGRDPYRFVPAWAEGWPPPQLTLEVAWVSETALSRDVPAHAQFASDPNRVWRLSPFSPQTQAEIMAAAYKNANARR